MKRLGTTILLLIVLLLYPVLPPCPASQAAYAAEVEFTAPVVVQDQETGTTTVTFRVDAGGLAQDGRYEAMAARYQEGRLIDVVSRTANVEQGELALTFDDAQPFNVCKLFALNQLSYGPVARNIEIVDGVVVTPMADQYAVVLDLADQDADRINSRPRLQLFLQDGTIKVYDTVCFEEEDLEVALFQGSGGILKWDLSKISSGTMIRFGVNRDDQINVIEGVAGLNEDLRLITGSGMTAHVTAKGYWNGKMLDPNAAVFAVDGEDLSDWDTYSNVFYEEMLDTDDVTAYAYIEKHGRITAMLVKEDFLRMGERYGVICSMTDKGGRQKELEAIVNRKEIAFTGEAAGFETATGSAPAELCRITFSTGGAMPSVIPFEAAEAENPEIHSLHTGKLDGPATLSGFTFEYGGGRVNLAERLTVYVQENGRWHVDTRDALGGLAPEDEVLFYDVYNDDERYDIALIHRYCAREYGVVLRMEDPYPNQIYSLPRVKLMLSDGTARVFTVREFMPEEAESVLFTKRDGQPCWNTELVRPGTLLRFTALSGPEETIIDSMEGVAGMEGNLQVVATTAGITSRVTEEGCWNGLRLAADAAAFAVKGDLTDEDSYWTPDYLELLKAGDLTVYAYIVENGQITALLAEDDFFLKGFRYAVFEGVKRQGSEILLKGYVDGRWGSYRMGSDVSLPEELERQEYGGLYKVEFEGGDGLIRSITPFAEAQAGDGAMAMTAAGAITGGAVLNGNVLEIEGGSNYTLDGGCSVYVWKDGSWRFGDRSDLSALGAGDSVELYDTQNSGLLYNIILIKEPTEADTYGVVLDMEDQDGASIASSAKLQLLLSDGTIQVFRVENFSDTDRESVLFLDVPYAQCWNPEQIKSGDLIKFGVDKNGWIDAIDGTRGMSSELGVVAGGVTPQAVTADGLLDGRRLSERAVLFAVYGKEYTYEDSYDLISPERVIGGEPVSIYSYVYNKNQDQIEAVLMKDTFLTAGTVYGVISGRAADLDGEEGIHAAIRKRALRFDASAEFAEEAERLSQAGAPEQLYQFVFDEQGTVRSAVSVNDLIASGAALELLKVGPLQGGEILRGTRFEYGEDLAVELTEDAVVYLHRDYGWQAGGIERLMDLKVGDRLEFYDTEGQDGHFDIALIKR